MRLKHVLRRLIGAPTFTIVTVLTLAIGMGANTAIFSVIQGVLLKPLPYQQPHRLVAVEHVAPGIIAGPTGSAPFLYFTDREQAHAFQNVAIWDTSAATVTGVAEPERIDTLVVTDGLLPVLGVQPAIGRNFTHQEDTEDGPRAVMLTYGYWQ